MSVLEFISSLKWPVVVLVALLVVSRALRKSPGLGEWARSWLDKRDVRGKVGPAEFEATASQAQAAAQIAVASDETLATLAEGSRQDSGEVTAETAREEVAALRREAVEAVMRQAAQWGWSAAKSGYAFLPRFDITWDETGRPFITERPTARDALGRFVRRVSESPEHQAELQQVVRAWQRRREQQSQQQPPSEE